MTLSFVHVNKEISSKQKLNGLNNIHVILKFHYYSRAPITASYIP